MPPYDTVFVSNARGEHLLVGWDNVAQTGKINSFDDRELNGITADIGFADINVTNATQTFALGNRPLMP